MSTQNTKTALTEAELADRWSVSIRTLQDWRRRGTGVGYLKLGKAIRYPREVVERYEAEHTGNVGGAA
ncbi:helix-turn-helix domain-containing protein [Methylobacter sp.]|uniref:helix-turn-helix domain-containing protein n=1 Tax=Methylobacter sp. TaxID=2051955 RepID=UPI003FA57B70